MAILGKITVEVLVDGKALQEYEDDDMENENPKSVVKYIEATSGAAFAIQVSVSEPYKIDSDSLTFQIFLDGNHSQTPLMIKAKHGRKDRSWKRTIAGVTRNGRNDAELKPFMFSDITRGIFMEHSNDAFTYKVQLIQPQCGPGLRAQAPSKIWELSSSRYTVNMSSRHARSRNMIARLSI